ncbi:putative copper resistance protein D [Jatrophihabitans sp. GAS493]|uniref:cytochrome c oxidase assembly protein n=1 Tax=Jatrophihabitans sp. GAS493 TaxID=1907575 RepID=UPI000BC0C73E|nr:cytochrome c oxidase assembly protein [Jatrophihabitans sp. GAS493]SOD71537.1 putative copper resistance protein D [Jatrophihabitans sp. GAS493]
MGAPTKTGQRPEPAARRTGLPDIALLAWILAAGILVTLCVYVLRHMSRSAGGHGAHDSMSDSLFRGGASPTGATLLGTRLITSWQLNSVAVGVVAILATAYLTALLHHRRRHPDIRWPIRSIVAFYCGLAVVIFATCGSIAVYDAALFSAHMLGHLSLVMLAPALLVLGHPLKLASQAAAEPTASRIRAVVGGSVVSLLTSPPVALASYTAVIVGSHLTGVMNVIMEHTWAAQVEHLVYLLVGCQFFALILGDEPLRWQLSTPIRWVLLAVSMAVDTFTGVVLMMSTEPISMQAPTGVGALSDTKTGGSIMWFGGDAIMAAIMVALAISWLGQSGRSGRDRASWLEQARAQTLAERASIASSPERDAITTQTADIDDSDADRDAYNQWLADMAKRS